MKTILKKIEIHPKYLNSNILNHINLEQYKYECFENEGIIINIGKIQKITNKLRCYLTILYVYFDVDFYKPFQGDIFDVEIIEIIDKNIYSNLYNNKLRICVNNCKTDNLMTGVTIKVKLKKILFDGIKFNCIAELIE